MDRQAFLLGRFGFGRVVIVEPGFTDADTFRVRGDRHELFHRGHGFVACRHRMRARGVEDRRMGLGDRADLRLQPELRADRDHAVHARFRRAFDERGVFPVKIGEVEMAMAVGDGRGRHRCPNGGPGSPPRFR